MFRFARFQLRSLFVTGAIILGSLALIYVAVSFASNYFRPTVQVQAGSGVYNLWVADTESQCVKGLSGIPTLAANGGLFMDFKTDDTWGIWMKDMHFPLDIIWLDKDKKVVYIVQNAQPETPVETVYRPKKPARYVLELPAGAVKQSAIKADMTVKISDNR